MVASARKGTRRATQSSRSAPPMDTDVIDLLSEDHRKVEELFEDYESSKDEGCCRPTFARPAASW